MKLLARSSAVAMAAGSYLACTVVQAQDQERPNILVIWGDDIGQSNISAYTMGVVGYRTPNIDRIADEGMIFTDYYGEQSCTAGRAAFIMGQSVFRTGLTKVGLPGADSACGPRTRPSPPCSKPQGYATGQFGKNHLGDRDEHLPTNHGFDEFFGNLYHLNAEEEPENEDYPEGPAVPRAVRPARRDPFLGQPRRHAADRGHRPADQEAHGDGRRRDLGSRGRLHQASRSGPTSRSSSGGTARGCTSARTSSPSCAASPGRTSTPTAWSSTTCTSASS